MFFGGSVTLGQTCDCCVRGGMVTASSNIDSGATGRLRRVYENGFRQSNLRFEIVALDGVGIIARSLDSQAWHSLCPPLAQRTTCIFTVSLAFLLAGIFLLTIAARHSQAYRTGTQNILKSSPNIADLIHHSHARTLCLTGSIRSFCNQVAHCTWVSKRLCCQNAGSRSSVSSFGLRTCRWPP